LSIENMSLKNSVQRHTHSCIKLFTKDSLFCKILNGIRIATGTLIKEIEAKCKILNLPSRGKPKTAKRY